MLDRLYFRVKETSEGKHRGGHRVIINSATCCSTQQSRGAVVKDFGQNKNPVGSFTTNIYDAEPKALIRIW